MNRLSIQLGLMICSLVAVAATAWAEEARTALVVGCDYSGTALKLPSPVRDAKSLGAVLKDQLGFEVTLLPNPTRKELLTAVDRFSQALKERGGVGLFYFSGHGSQNGGENYLIPVGASLGYREDLPTETVSAQQVVTQMEAAGNPTNLLFLDACRDNPLPSAKKKGAFQQGFAGMNAANGMLIGFATAPDTAANDGGEGSLYTNALLKYITTPGLSVTDMLTRVNADVRKVSGGTQIPFMEVGLSDVFSFAPLIAKTEGVDVGASLEMKQIAIEEQHDDHSAKRFLLRIPIQSRPTGELDLHELVVHVLFYDIIAGRDVVRTGANVKYHWDKTPVSWMNSDTEELQVEYQLPKPDSHTPQSKSRKYFGYIVRFYYKQRLLGATAVPDRLAQEYPPPDTLPEEPKTIESRSGLPNDDAWKVGADSGNFPVYVLKLREKMLSHMEPEVVVPTAVRVLRQLRKTPPSDPHFSLKPE